MQVDGTTERHPSLKSKVLKMTYDDGPLFVITGTASADCGRWLMTISWYGRAYHLEITTWLTLPTAVVLVWIVGLIFGTEGIALLSYTQPR